MSMGPRTLHTTDEFSLDFPKVRHARLGDVRMGGLGVLSAFRRGPFHLPKQEQMSRITTKLNPCRPLFPPHTRPPTRIGDEKQLQNSCKTAAKQLGGQPEHKRTTAKEMKRNFPSRQTAARTRIADTKKTGQGLQMKNSSKTAQIFFQNSSF